MVIHAEVRWVWDAELKQTTLFKSALFSVVSPPTAFVFQFTTLCLVYFSIVHHLPAVIIPSMESTVFPSVWQTQRIWFCCETTAHLLSFSHCSSPSLPSPAAPLPQFLCWQKPILDGVSFCVMYLSHQPERVFSHTLQGPLTLRFIVGVEAEVDCLLSVMYFHWCPDTGVQRWALTINKTHFCRCKHTGGWVGETSCVEIEKRYN